MKYSINIESVNSIREIEGAWSTNDLIELLQRFNYPDAESSPPGELRELLFMAINDYEPEEAAEIILNYRLPDKLSMGQIQQISNEMREDKIAEEYSDISLHYQFFNINQLLLAAYNGKFPSVKASELNLVLSITGKGNMDITKEILLKALCGCLSDNNLIKRLYSDGVNGKIAFPEAESIVWEMHKFNDDKIKLITSDYWINKDDIALSEAEGVIVEFEPEEED
jgi:hypothetical protein